jgi:hypothetical protein
MDQRRSNLDPRPSGLPTVLEVIDRTHHGGGSGAATATQTPSMGEESLSGMDSSPRSGRNEHAGRSGAGGANRRSDWDWSAGLRARSTPLSPNAQLSPFILRYTEDHPVCGSADRLSSRHRLTTCCGLGGPRSGRNEHAERSGAGGANRRSDWDVAERKLPVACQSVAT